MSDGFEKKGPSEAVSIGETFAAEDMKVYEESVDLMLTAGLSREECEKILFDDTNPYVIWYLDFINSMSENSRWAIDEKATKKTGNLMFKDKKMKTSVSLRNTQKLLQWEELIHPYLLKMIDKFGGEMGLGFDELRDGLQRVIADRVRYPYFETWLNLVIYLGNTVGLGVQERAFNELLSASGYEADSSEQSVDYTKLDVNLNPASINYWLEEKLKQVDIPEKGMLEKLTVEYKALGYVENDIEEYWKKAKDFEDSLWEKLGWMKPGDKYSDDELRQRVFDDNNADYEELILEFGSAKTRQDVDKILLRKAYVHYAYKARFLCSNAESMSYTLKHKSDPF